MAHFLGILPARSGSKGIRNKNLRTLAGKPLLGWAAEALVGAGEIEMRICSTDSEDIAEVAKSFGLDVPFLRPGGLATDDSPVLNTIEHSLEQLAQRGSFFSHVVLVQATSPTVTSSDIELGIQIVREEGLDSLVTAFEFSHHLHPGMMFERADDGRVKWLLGDSESSKRRQDRARFLARAGLLYIFSASDIIEKKSLWGDRIGYIEIEKDRAISIDDEEDFLRAEAYFKGSRLKL